MYMYTQQVLWLGRERCDVTWEPAESVPVAVVQEFERGVVAAVTDHMSLSGIGQTRHTLTVGPSDSSTLTSHTAAARTVIRESEGCEYL